MEEELGFALTTEIKCTVSWPEDMIKTPEHEKFEQEIQTIANMMNAELPTILLTAIKTHRKINVF